MNLYTKPGVLRHDAALFRDDPDTPGPRTESADMSSPHKDLPTRGSVLLYLIAVMTIFGVLGAAMLSLSTTSRESVFSANATNRARFLAESGLRIAQARYCAGDDFDTSESITITLLSGEQVRVDKLPADAGFSAEATAFAGSLLEARAKVFGILPECGTPVDPGFVGDSPDDYVVYTGGSGSEFVLPSGGIVDGSVFAGEVEIKPNSTITGNVISIEDVEVGSGTKIGGYICSANGDVELKSSGTVVTGNIYAKGDVILKSGTTVLGSIFATGKVELESSNVYVGGDIHAGEEVIIGSGNEVRGSVFSRGEVELKDSNAKVGGDIHAREEVILGSQARVAGSVYSGGDIEKKSSATIGQGSFKNQSSPPRINPLPPTGCPPTPPKPKKQTFSAGSIDFNVAQSTSRTVPPGTYRNLNFGGGATVTLQAGNCSGVGQPGCYVFQSFGPARWGQTLRLDFTTGNYITVFVKGNISFSGPILVKTNDFGYTNIQDLPIAVTRELAKRVYWETHGSFTISNDSQRQWFGSVLSQNDITLGSGFFGIGALATVSGEIKIADGSTNITYVIADFAKNHWLP